MTKKFDLLLTCADGLEQALLMELASFGIKAKQLAMGRIGTTVGLKQLYHICLYSRVVSRVLLPLLDHDFVKSQSDNTDMQEDVANVLYDVAKAYDWTKLLDVHHTFAIRTSVDKRLAVNQQFVTMRIKDAIADRFNAQFGKRPSVDTQKPNFTISVHVGCDKAWMALDLSGVSLHRRGYRIANTDAPLKENLAAALLHSANWQGEAFDVLLDPMCGSGTFIIEALLMLLDYPVGIDKANDALGFCHWHEHDAQLWQDLVLQAQDRFHYQLQHAKLPKTYAFDSNPIAIKALTKNIMASALAPIADKIEFAVQELKDLPKTLQALAKNAKLFFITNPPYGERLGDEALLKPLYQGMGLMLRHHAPNQTTVGVLAGKVEEADLLPLHEHQTLRCHNGALTVYFRHGQLNGAPLPSMIDDYQTRPIEVDNDDHVMDFVNRLQKNLNHLKKPAQKQQINNLRIYDADLPNYNAAIDIYGDKVHVQEYAPPKNMDEAVARRRFNLMLMALRQIFNIDREAIFVKMRTRQSGKEQYMRQSGKKSKRHIVGEHGAYFYVNLTDYLDTGLFIDHRPMRQIIKQQACQKTVLNLYAYTCTASVQAAMGGAKKVVSVDLSDNYLHWGKQNFALNGFDVDARFDFVCADVFEWIKQSNERFDLIFIDPPTFSNSKKFYGTFDVQRDHVSLIKRAMNRLNPDGVLYFSNNFSKFVIDELLCHWFDVAVMTHQTIGFDFKKGIHQSYAIRHKMQQHAVWMDEIKQANDDKTNHAHLKQAKSAHKMSRHKPSDGRKFIQANSQTKRNNKDGQMVSNQTQNKHQSKHQSKHKALKTNPSNKVGKVGKMGKVSKDKQVSQAKHDNQANGFKRLIATGENKRVFVNPKHKMTNQSDDE